MPRLSAAAAAALLAVAAACNPLEPDGPVQRTLLVQHHMEECTGEGIRLCLLLRGAGDPTYHRHYDGIEGFTFQWGYAYEIEVREYPVANPPADGSSIRTVLRRVIDRQRVAPGTEFETFLTAGEHRIAEVAPDRYRFHHEAEFVCPAGAGCAELRSEIAAGARVLYRFRHAAAAADPLVLVRWQRCDASLTGSALCTR